MLPPTPMNTHVLHVNPMSTFVIYVNPWVHLYFMWTPVTVLLPETWRNTAWSLSMPIFWVNPMSTPVPYVNPSDCVLQGLGLYAARDLEKHSMVIEYVCTLCGPHEYTCTYVNPSDCVLQGLGLYAARDLEKHTVVIEYVCTLCGPHEYTCTLCEPQWLCLAGFGTVCCQRPGETHCGHWVCLYFVWTPWVHLYLMWTPVTVSCRVWDCMLPETWRNTLWSLSTPVLCLSGFGTVCCQRPGDAHHGHWVCLYFVWTPWVHLYLMWTPVTVSCRVWDCMLPETWRNTLWSLSTPVLCLSGFGTVCCQRPGDAHHGHWVHLYFVLQGLGLYAARDLEKHTMVIEYIGDLIRNETANRREKEYDDQVCLHSCQSPSAPVLWVSFCWLLALKLATT